MGADTKLVEDWRERPQIEMPPDAIAWRLGEMDDADVVAEVILFGDYQEENTREADAIIRDRLARQPGIRYTFRHSPFDQACNPNVSKTFHPQACLASRAAEAAGILGGADGYWNMHRWLWPNQRRFNRENFKAAGRGFGFDPEEFGEAMYSDLAEAALQEDIAAMWDLGIRSVPSIFVNNRLLPRWKLQDGEGLTLFFDTLLGPAHSPPAP